MRIFETSLNGTPYDIRFDYEIVTDANGLYPISIEEVRNCETQCALNPRSPTYQMIVGAAMPYIQAELRADEKKLTSESLIHSFSSE